MNQPDMNSWRLFAGAVANAATPGNDKVLFETWASDFDTFTANPQWPAPQAPKLLTVAALTRQKLTFQNRLTLAAAPPKCEPNGAKLCIGEESRRNRVAFDYIVNNKLYTQAGLAAYFGKPVVFPIDTIEVKADWIPVEQLPGWNGTRPADVQSLYHVSNVQGRDGKTVAYALVGIHVISKQVPNWTWATFEHWMNPGRCDFNGCRDDFGAVQSATRPNPKPDKSYPKCEASERLLDLFKAANLDPKWQNYCLRGSQTDFVTPTGATIILGNSVIEGLNGGGVPVTESSCMTCHATAAFNRNGKTLQTGIKDNKVGSPQPSWFRRGRQSYQQADFVWAIPFCALTSAGKSACVPN